MKVSARIRVIALLTLVLGVVAGGVAYASIPDSNGVIHGCYSKSGGDIRVIDSSVTSCSSKETSLTWNQTGPVGPQGPKGDSGATGAQGTQGPQGPQGPAGSAGVSNGYSATNTHVVDTDAGSGSQQIVGLSGLPGGDYIVWATITNGGDNVNSDSMQCRLDGPSGEVSPGTYYEVGPEIDYGFSTTLTGVVKDAPDDFELSVDCGKNSAVIFDTPPIANADIEAIPIGSLQ